MPVLASMEPFPEPLLILHVNFAVGALERNAVNCTCWFTGTLAAPGKMVTGPRLLGVGVGGGVVLVFPQEANTQTTASKMKPAALTSRTFVIRPVPRLVI